LNDRCNQVVDILAGGTSTGLSANVRRDERNQGTPRRYYFLLPMRKRRKAGRLRNLNILCAFGPYFNSYELNFIKTSAIALGLL